VVIFLNEEAAYFSWIAHHRNGFVLDWLRKPTKKQPVVHRARCSAIKRAKTKRTHWTTGRHMKACSLDIEELVAWAKKEAGAEPAYCEQCAPTNESVSFVGPHDRHLTKLGKEIVDYVVEIALIHLDQADSEYALSVGDVAKCVDKTPGQITPGLLRLVEDGYLRLQGDVIAGTTLPVDYGVYPTEDALRTLPAFKKMSKRKIKAELDILTDLNE
jgi:hypothetical protein